MAYAALPATTGYRAGYKQDDVIIAYGRETAWGTPATAGMLLRYTGDSLASGEQTKATNEFDGSRSASPVFRTSFQAGGTLNGLWSAGSIDDIFASCFASNWNNVGQLNDGSGTSSFNVVSPSFLTIEKNLGGAYWLQYPGSFVTKLALSFRSQSEVTWSADVIAKTENQLTAAGFTSYAAASTAPIIKFGANMTSKVFNGAAMASFLDQLDITFENTGAARQYGDGGFGAVGVDIGMFNCSGSFRAYFNGPSLYNAFSSQTVAPLTFMLTDDSGNSYTIRIKAARLTTPTQPTSARGQDLMQTFNFVGQKDSSGGICIITRNPVGGVAGSFSYFAP